MQIKTYSIIYKAIEDIDAARIGMLKPTEEEIQTGIAEVRELFRVPKVGVVAGCMVTEGEIERSDKVRVVRDGVVVFDGVFARCAASRTTSRASRAATSAVSASSASRTSTLATSSRL